MEVLQNIYFDQNGITSVFNNKSAFRKVPNI